VTTLLEADPRVLANAWLEVDPDEETRAETIAILDTGGPDLVTRFGERLGFGTAGLRGPLGAGPNRMNRVLVRIAAAALGNELVSTSGARVVVGHDARHGSRSFAEDTVRVLARMGVPCTLFPEPVPTPVLAFAVRHLDAAAGVMVTASHNPRPDNGYKIYWRGGTQISHPIDERIAATMLTTPLPTEDDLAPFDDAAITSPDPSLMGAYLDAVVGLLDPTVEPTARVAYTPLHGVGRDTLLAAFARAGFASPHVVGSQGEPDPDFPTTPFPNPEEPGALGPLLELAAVVGADVALANDPDADRLAVAVPNGLSWRLLTGDEVGCVLAEYLLQRSPAKNGEESLVVNTIVSSSLLSKIAARHGARHERTLTGFKWIMNAGADRPNVTRVLGYEEALGYCIGDIVGDKDGISAALVVGELVSWLQRQGRSILDLLDELDQRHGVHVTGQRSIRFETPTGRAEAMKVLRDQPPESLGRHRVERVVDRSVGDGSLPPTDAVEFELEHGRVIIRPSGTEPKLKIYGELVVDVGESPRQDRNGARRELADVLAKAAEVVAAPERRLFELQHSDTVADAALLERGNALHAQVISGVNRAKDLRLVVQCIDLTTLEGDDTLGRVRALCAQARRPDPADPTVGPTAAVCVYPSLVAQAASLTSGSAVRVASVAGAFPSGLSPSAVRQADIAAAVDAGADEIDIVLNRAAYLDGDLKRVADDVAAAKAILGDIHLKVILEVGELSTPALVRGAAVLAMEAGADFIKTSTGKSKASATPASVMVMAEAIADHRRQTGRMVGIKVAGGVRTADDALGYVAIVRSVLGEQWLTPTLLRFGASSLLASVLDDLVVTESSLRS
jgi:phosphomannomutase